MNNFQFLNPSYTNLQSKKLKKLNMFSSPPSYPSFEKPSFKDVLKKIGKECSQSSYLDVLKDNVPPFVLKMLETTCYESKREIVCSATIEVMNSIFSYVDTYEKDSFQRVKSIDIDKVRPQGKLFYLLAVFIQEIMCKVYGYESGNLHNRGGVATLMEVIFMFYAGMDEDGFPSSTTIPTNLHAIWAGVNQAFDAIGDEGSPRYILWKTPYEQLPLDEQKKDVQVLKTFFFINNNFQGFLSSEYVFANLMERAIKFCSIKKDNLNNHDDDF